MRGENPHARTFAFNCVFISKPTLKALETPGRPFLHDVNPARRPMPCADEMCVLLPWSHAIVSELVEPDGLEPTTSCLQSTRSTN